MHYLRKLKGRQEQKPTFVNKTDCKLDINDFNGNGHKPALAPKMRKIRSVREGAHRFATGSKGSLQSSTKASLKAEHETKFIERSEANEKYDSSNNFIVNLPDPATFRQDTMRTESTARSETSDESLTIESKGNGSAKHLTHKKSLDKVDISQSKAQELCDMLEQNNGRNTDLNKLQLIPSHKKNTASYFSIQGMTKKLSRKDSNFHNATEVKTAQRDGLDIDDREQKSERRPPTSDKDALQSLVPDESDEVRNTDSPKSVSKHPGIHDPIDHCIDKDLIVPGCSQNSEMSSSEKEPNCRIGDNLDQSKCQNALNSKFYDHILC